MLNGPLNLKQIKKKTQPVVIGLDKYLYSLKQFAFIGSEFFYFIWLCRSLMWDILTFFMCRLIHCVRISVVSFSYVVTKCRGEGLLSYFFLYFVAFITYDIICFINFVS